MNKNNRRPADAPPCEPNSKRIGAHLYNDIPDARAQLQECLTKNGGKITELWTTNWEYARELIIQMGSIHLDLTEPTRANELCRASYIATRSDGPTPPIGTILYDVPRWPWRIEAGHVLYPVTNNRKERIADRMVVLLHESPDAPFPTTHNPSWGFWGTWRTSEELAVIPPEDAWEAMFALYGDDDPHGRHNRGLRDLLDSRPARHYVDRLSHRPAICSLAEARSRMKTLGRPDKWYTGEYGTPIT